jgi:hypothetical protein
MLEPAPSAAAGDDAAPIWFAPASIAPLAERHGLRFQTFDDVGDFNGALGLIQAAAAVKCLRDGGRRALLSCGGSGGGVARCSLALAR